MDMTVKLSDLLTVLAALLGPILAVQAQKWVERRQARNAIKDEIFKSLMATRATRLSAEHVQALNMIDIAFYGKNVRGERKQTKVEKNVTRAWHEYFATLQESVGPDGTQDQHGRLMARRDDKFNELLVAIATAQGYDFEALELRQRRYNPEAHNNLENQALAIRTGVEAVLSGRQSIKMELTNLPPASGNHR